MQMVAYDVVRLTGIFGFIRGRLCWRLWCCLIGRAFVIEVMLVEWRAWGGSRGASHAVSCGLWSSDHVSHRVLRPCPQARLLKTKKHKILPFFSRKYSTPSTGAKILKHKTQVHTYLCHRPWYWRETYPD